MNDNAANQRKEKNQASPGEGACYEIRVRGYLNNSWSDWMEGLEVEPAEHGETILSGPVRDQAALFGILNRLASLNVTLLSVFRREA